MSPSPQDLPPQDLPITQIIHLTNNRPNDPSRGGHLFSDSKWQAALDYCTEAPGFQRIYWGESLEHPKHVEIHIVRNTLSQHQDFLASDNYRFFIALVDVLTNKNQNPVIRHAALRDFTPGSQALARGAPFSGTAIYINRTAAWDEGAWPLWTHIVRYVDGCLGCSGGPILEEKVESVKGSLGRKVEGRGEREEFERCYVVYVGWATTEAHHDYHGTKHFAEHSVILRCGNEGYAEYGHIVFQGERVKEVAAKL